MAQIYKHHGTSGLFAGLTPRLIKVAPACAIMIATFEYSKVAIIRLANISSRDRPLLSNANVNDIGEISIGKKITT